MATNMKKAFALWLLAAGLVAGAAGMGHAQEMATQGDNSGLGTVGQDNSKVVVLAGCLERGSGAGEYALLGQNLHWWELRSDSVNLNVYLNREIRITAFESPSDDGTLTVIDLTMVATSCSQW